MDADVIKTYVELGAGRRHRRGNRLRRIARPRFWSAIDARHLFAANMTRLAVRRGSYLREFVYDFIATFSAAA